MSLIQFFRIFNRNLNIFLLCSLVLAVVVFYFTRNLPKTYESETELYTGIASGLNVNSVEKATLDYFATSNAYDNLINVIRSRQTSELTGELLLVQHLMLDTMDTRYLGEEAWRNLNYMVPPALRDSLVVKDDSTQTLQNIQNYKRQHYESDRVKLIFFDETSPYSHKAVSNVVVERIGNSDLMRLRYAWTDPGIVQNTLIILNKVFTQGLSNIKRGQGADVVEYFRRQLAVAEAALNAKENELKEFRVKNRIINYTEQTKSIASQKESMEDEYQKEVALKAATEASLERLEEQLALNKEILKYAQQVLIKKDELAEVTSKIAELEVFSNDAELLKNLRTRQQQLTAQIKRDLNTRYQYSKTKEGLPVRNVLEEWLNYSLALNESKARLEVFQNRKKYFNRKYEEMSPLGSTIDKMTREIAVQERNYLQQLNSLNNALMRQESETVSTGGLIVTVPPYYPVQPLKSKALLLVLVAGVIGFVVPFALVLIMEFLDNTIKTPERAEELTSQKLLGAYPNLSQRSEVKHIDMEWLKDHAAGLMSQNLRLQTRRQALDQKKPKYVLIYSTRESEGKAFIGHVLANELVSLNFRVLLVGKLEDAGAEDQFYDYAKYERNKQFLNTQDFAEIIPPNYDHTLYDYVFFVISSVISEQYPIALIEKADMAINCVNVNRSWKKGDTFALKEFSQTLSIESRLVANGVAPDYMDVVLGEIKKQRSFLHKLFKSVINLEFKSKKMRRDY
jgi:uncharacterized protein involved in exopolysaccharide biosynthesis